jgi:hypothetical protein
VKNGILSYNHNRVKYSTELMFASLVVESTIKAIFICSLGGVMVLDTKQMQILSEENVTLRGLT